MAGKQPSAYTRLADSSMGDARGQDLNLGNIAKQHLNNNIKIMKDYELKEYYKIIDDE